jgi:hypothetical protein
MISLSLGLGGTQQRERDYGVARFASLFNQCGFKLMGHQHFASGYFVLTGAHEAKFAMPESVPVAHPHRGTENPARHWPPDVYIAPACRRIESRTGRVVGELLKSQLILIGLTKKSRRHIPRKRGSMFLDPPFGASFDLVGQPGIGDMERFHAYPQALGVKGVDRKSAMTTLCAAQPANKSLAGSASRVGQRSIHNLHKFRVSSRQLHAAKHT